MAQSVPTAKPPVPTASPTSYSASKGRCRCTYPMDKTCAELSSSTSPPGADLVRRSSRTLRRETSVVHGWVSSPEKGSIHTFFFYTLSPYLCTLYWSKTPIHDELHGSM
jgi:hypothetical protein